MTKTFKFLKFQGCGNDFIIRDETEGPRTSDRERSRLARLLTDRHFKVGADGIIFIESASGIDGSMRLFEPAGNEADMCGNGIRCVGAYLMAKLGKDSVDVLTRDGVKRIAKIDEEYRVDMGIVRFTRNHLKRYIMDPGKDSDSMLNIALSVGKRTLQGSIVNSGEPHIVVRVKDIDCVDVVGIGTAVNKDTKRFPNGVNINFVQIVGPHTMRVRTYERGVYGETLACGTGATACAAVARKLGWLKSGTVAVKPRGGTIRVDFDDSWRATMTGPATCEFEGSIRV